jgi:hypothetical protein
MSNILINPNSGLIEFATGVAGGSSFISNVNFTGGSSYSARLSHDNLGGLNIVSYTTGSGVDYSGVERFSIDGNNGRLFSVTDNLSGSLFSVNDIAGLPIIEAFDDNTVVMGAFNRNDFVLTGNSLGLGGLPNTGTTKLYVSGNVSITSGNVTVNNTNVALSNQIFSAFPPGTGVRRYRPDGVLTLGTVAPPSGFIGYFPIIIKKFAINPKISVEVSTVVNPTPIRYGIYSGISGFEGARLFNSGSIDCPSVLGVYTSNISVDLPEGPYIIGTSNTGVASPHSFRAAAASIVPVMFGEPTGNSLFGGSTIHYYESGSDLRTIIGTGLIATTAAGPIPYISY